MDIVVWLRSLGLGKYEAAFRENEITEKVLPNLTAEDLKELGVACSMLSLLCVTTRVARRPPLTQRPRRVPQAHNQKTVPNAAK
jgi:SAM domain (Sterile alpha motif)